MMMATQPDTTNYSNVAGTTGTKEPALCIEAGYPMLLQVGSYCG